MFLHKGKEYYPLDVAQIVSADNNVIYDRDKRNKPYLYIVLENNQNEGAKI